MGSSVRIMHLGMHADICSFLSASMRAEFCSPYVNEKWLGKKLPTRAPHLLSPGTTKINHLANLTFPTLDKENRLFLSIPMEFLVARRILKSRDTEI
jgi:hypothetical protein